jgi:LuxR family maltose regulon positive regulatory protein
VLWITGPPGCGKTVLISSYVEARRPPCIWYKVDESDADLSTFFYYLGLAAANAAPRKKKRLPLLTPERLPGLSVFAQRYFEDLSSILSVPSLLVLDDCHRVPEDSPFFGTLREGISRLAPGMAAVLISRNDPHPSFARERANRQMELFGWEELRLTAEEATGIVKLRRKGKLPAGLVSDLLRQTNGWAAGLVLLLERATLGPVDFRISGKQVPSELIDYFGSEIFQGLDEGQRNFLLRTAFLPRMTATMAENLTGSERASQILSGMYRHNLFTEKYPQRDPVYVYHALFREFLLEEAINTFSQVDLARIRCAAAALLEENGNVEDAAELFRQAGDWNSLTRLILSQATSLVAQGRYRTILEWLGGFAKVALYDDPWLLYWKGICLMPFSPAESHACFEEALKTFDLRREAPGVFLSWSGAVESIVVAMDNFMPVDNWVSLLPQLLDRYGGLPSGDVGDRVTCSIYRALSFRQYPRVDVESWTPRAVAVARASTDTRLKFLLTTAILTTTLSKDTREAERTIASLRITLKQPDAAPVTRLLLDMVEAVLSIVTARHERCFRVANEGLAFAENMGIHFADSFLEAFGAMAALKMHDFDTANGSLERMAASLGSMKPLPSGLFHCINSCEALYRGDPARAAIHSEECLRLWEESGFTTHVPSAHILSAHVHHALHEDEEALRHMAEARRIGTETEIPIGVWLSYLTEAYFHIERNDDTSPIASLGKGMEIGRKAGMLGTFLWLPDMLGNVAARALEAGIEVDYVRELIRRNRLAPDPENPGLEKWPWPVKIFTLGRFELLVDDRPVAFGRKVQRRPLELLKALVALGGRDVSEGRLTELLWPEADGDLAHQSFTAALSRLRKLLGTDEALVLKEGRLSLSTLHCWVDAWAFERFLGQAEKARKEGKETEAIRALEKGLSIYKGSFLQSEEADWLISRREKLRGGFLRMIANLGRYSEKMGRWNEAASYYEKGLDVDEVAEELYRHLIICHIRSGREAEALSVYRRCRKMLLTVLGVAPSTETNAVVASLGRS